MTKVHALVLLDRDGVLNPLVVDQEHGTIDSPLHPDQVKIYSWVPRSLALLCSHGYGVAIVTNQPAYAKGKTTKKNLEMVHQKVVELSEVDGAKILSSHICFHRQEDSCLCRKPMPGLLEEAFRANPQFSRSVSWMVGDGITDVQAGARLSLKTAFIGSKKWDIKKVFEEIYESQPTFFVENLKEFAEVLLSGEN